MKRDIVSKATQQGVIPITFASILFTLFCAATRLRCLMMAWNVVWCIGASLLSLPRKALKPLWMWVSTCRCQSPLDHYPQDTLTPVLGVFDSFGMWEGEDWIGQFT